MKCQSCAILRKPCVGGIRKVSSGSETASAGSGSIIVRPSTANVPSSSRRKTSKASVATSSSTVPEGLPFRTVYDAAGGLLGQVTKPPTVDLTNPSLSRKRSALASPSTAVPSASKVLRPSISSSVIRRTSSAISSSPLLPSPLVLSPSLPSGLGSSSPMVVDPPEDQVLLLLDALEFAIERGNLEDARMRIRALRKLRRDELRSRGA